MARLTSFGCHRKVVNEGMMLLAREQKVLIRELEGIRDCEWQVLVESVCILFLPSTHVKSHTILPFSAPSSVVGPAGALPCSPPVDDPSSCVGSSTSCLAIP